MTRGTLPPPTIPGISLIHPTARIHSPLSLYVPPFLPPPPSSNSEAKDPVREILFPFCPPIFLLFLPAMGLLQMPVEALVLRIHSIPAAAGSLWACLAVLTAALVLWRMRAVGSRSEPSLPHSLPPPKLGPAEPAQAAAPAPTPAPAPPQCHAENVGTPKARFTAYYDSCGWFGVGDDGDDEEGENRGREVDGVGDVRAPSTAPWEGLGWEGLMVRRRGELGWYRYQDLTALNGSVVRLWDGDGVLTATSRKTSLIGL